MSNHEALFNRGAEIGNKILEGNEKVNESRTKIENIIKKLKEEAIQDAESASKKLSYLLSKRGNGDLTSILQLAEIYAEKYIIEETPTKSNDTSNESADFQPATILEAKNKYRSEAEILKKAEAYKIKLQSANKELKDAIESIDIFSDKDEEEQIKKSGEKVKKLMTEFLQEFYTEEQKVLFKYKEWDKIMREYTELSLGLRGDYEDASNIFNEKDKELGVGLLTARIEFLPNDCDPQEVFNIVGQFHHALDSNYFISDKIERNYKELTNKISKAALEKLSSIEDNQEASKALLNFAKKVSGMDSFQSDGEKYDFDDRFIDMEIAREAIVRATERNNKSVEDGKGTLFERVSQKQGYEDKELEGVNRNLEINNFRESISKYTQLEPFLDFLCIEEQELSNGEISDFTLGIIVRINKKFKGDSFTGDFTAEEVKAKLEEAATDAREEAMQNIDLEEWGGLASIDGDDLVREGVISENEKDLLDTYTDLVGVGLFDLAEDNKDDAIKIGATIAVGIVTAPIIATAGAVTLGAGAVATGLTLGAQALAMSTAASVIYGEGYDSGTDFVTKFGSDFTINLITLGGLGSIAKYASKTEMTNILKYSLFGGVAAVGMAGEAGRQSYLYDERGDFLENLMTQGVAQGLLSILALTATRGAAKIKARGGDLSLPEVKLRHPIETSKKYTIKLRDVYAEGMKRDTAMDSPIFKKERLQFSNGKLESLEGVEIKFPINKTEGPFGEEKMVGYITKGLKAEDAVYKKSELTGEITIFDKKGNIIGEIDKKGSISIDKTRVKEIKDTIRTRRIFDEDIKASKGNKSEVETTDSNGKNIFRTNDEIGNPGKLNIKKYPFVLFDKKNSTYVAYNKNGKDCLILDHNKIIVDSTKLNTVKKTLEKTLRREEIKTVKIDKENAVAGETTYITSEGKKITLKGIDGENDVVDNLTAVYNKKTDRIELLDKHGELKMHAEKIDGVFGFIDSTEWKVKQIVFGRNAKLSFHGEHFDGDTKYFKFYDGKKTFLYNNEGKLFGEINNDGVIKSVRRKKIVEKSIDVVNNDKIKYLGDKIQKLSKTLDGIDEATLKNYLQKKGANKITTKVFWAIVHGAKKLSTRPITGFNNTTIKPLMRGKERFNNSMGNDSIMKNGLEVGKNTALTGLDFVNTLLGKGVKEKTVNLSLFIVASGIGEIYDYNNGDVTFEEKFDSMNLSDMGIQIGQEIYKFATLGIVADIIYEMIDDDSIEE